MIVNSQFFHSYLVANMGGGGGFNLFNIVKDQDIQRECFFCFDLSPKSIFLIESTL